MMHAHDRQSLHQPRSAQELGQPLISFEDFCFAYEDEAILRHVTLEVFEGDCAVLMGDNGSGKSTLLKAISGLIHPMQGSYHFDGQEVSEKSMRRDRFAKWLHGRVGFIFQDSDTQLFCASVEEELAFGPVQLGLGEQERRQRVEDGLSLLGIERLRGRAPWTLSGGEKRRVAIASVVTMNPDVYCFDEPLAGLDAASRSWLLGFLKQLKQAGKTLIIATHDQSLADELADYFVYMGETHGYDDRPHLHINV